MKSTFNYIGNGQSSRDRWTPKRLVHRCCIVDRNVDWILPNVLVLHDVRTPLHSPSIGYCSSEDRLGLVLAGRLELTGILGVGAYGIV
jgi:hypothetical protein